ncbi:periostin-like isoform X1 [Asterias amurensis]|uniref:periostin-like isoform X1 n=1 Tax=Asterias amurensis TaxID=7602 RepID=UPI003AB24612
MFFSKLLVWFLSAFGCSSLLGDDANIAVYDNDILQVCQNAGALTFAKYARSIPWVNQTLGNLSSTGYTALAPTDRAFDRLPKAVKIALQDPQVLEWYLRYHIGLTEVYTKVINNNLRIPSAFRPPGKMEDQPEPVLTIRFNVYDVEYDGKANLTSRFGKTVTATGAPIIHPDLQASNGIVHIINKVMFPIPMGVNMPDFLKKDPRFSLLFSFLTKANLTGALATDPSKPLTIFAPNDAAFKKLPKAVVDKLANVTFLQEVLEYHVVNAALYAAGLYDNQKLVPLAGGTILVLIGPGGVFVDNEQVIQTDTTVVNGVIHEVSGVLIPPAK